MRQRLSIIIVIALDKASEEEREGKETAEGAEAEEKKRWKIESRTRIQSWSSVLGNLKRRKRIPCALLQYSCNLMSGQLGLGKKIKP